jgi:phosphoribosylformylglycinamidine cyclo-ligase
MITDEEMFRTFNMGWGFAIIVDKKDADKALGILEKAGAEAEHVGNVTAEKRIEICYGDKRIILQ